MDKGKHLWDNMAHRNRVRKTSIAVETRIAMKKTMGVAVMGMVLMLGLHLQLFARKKSRN